MGGVQVCPGDIVGCDDDGIVVVPQAVAAIVAAHAREVLLADMRKRAKHFAELGYPADDSVDVTKVEKHYADLDAAAGGGSAR